MKKLVVLIALFCCVKAGFGQVDSSLLYLRFPTIPPFHLTRVSDSAQISKDDLKKKTPTIIMIFSPDCEHCQKETRMLTANIALFKNAQIIMVSPLEHVYLKKFYEEYHIADYPNITIARDPNYFLGTFYHVRSFPSIFVYDKKGNFVNAFDGSVPVERIAAAL